MPTLEKKGGKNSTSNLVCGIIGAFLMYAAGYIIPAWGTVTQMGVHILCIFVGLIVCISGCSSITWPCLMALSAVVICGYQKASTMWANIYGNSTVVQLIFFLVLCGELRERGIGEVIANWLFTRKGLKGRPNLTLAVMFTAFFICGFMFGSTSAVLLSFSIWEGIRDSVGCPKKGKFAVLMYVVIYHAAVLSYSLLPNLRAIPSAIVTFEGLLGGEVKLSGSTYLILQIVIGIVVIGGSMIWMNIRYRDEVKKLANYDASQFEGKATKLTTEQSIILVAFIIAISYSFILVFLDKTSGFYKFFNGLGLPLWVALICVLLGFVRVKGQKLLNLDMAMKKHVMWGLLTISATMQLLGKAVGDTELGITDWITQLLGPVFNEMSWPLFVFITMIGATILTNIMSNNATSLIFLSLTAPFLGKYIADGIDATVFFTAIQYASKFAYLTYAAAATSPLLMDRIEREGSSNKEMFTAGLVPAIIFVVFGSIVFIVAGYIF